MGLSIYIDKYKKNGEFKELLFFKKVNFLLPFFDYTENYEDIEINKQQVEDLVNTCKQVLKEKPKAKTLLPNTEGFFFGSTEYDEMYFDNVKLVLQRFQHLLKTFNFEKDKLIMSCSW
jgi:hypothetical protein